jgi:hypothetical protein
MTLTSILVKAHSARTFAVHHVKSAPPSRVSSISGSVQLAHCWDSYFGACWPSAAAPAQGVEGKRERTFLGWAPTLGFVPCLVVSSSSQAPSTPSSSHISNKAKGSLFLLLSLSLQSSTVSPFLRSPIIFFFFFCGTRV